jgi:hypothetical protein
MPFCFESLFQKRNTGFLPTFADPDNEPPRTPELVVETGFAQDHVL